MSAASEGLQNRKKYNTSNICTVNWCAPNIIREFREAKPGGFQTGGFPTFSGKVQIVSRTLSGLFLVGAVNRLRKRKRTNRENPRRVPGQIGKIPKKSGKSQKGRKRTKKGRTSPDRETPPPQRALRDRLMSRGKNCLPTVSRQFLTRNYPRPNCLPKMPLKLSLPHKRGSFYPLSKLTPR